MLGLRQWLREAQILAWDLWIRTFGIERIARMLTKASDDVAKWPLVVFVESNTGYGNVRACAADMRSLLGRDEVEVLAVCDVDTTRRETALKRVRDAYAAKPGSAATSCVSA